MKNFIEFKLYNTKQRILIDINDIRSITEQEDNTCVFYIFSDTEKFFKVDYTYDDVIERLKKARLN